MIDYLTVNHIYSCSLFLLSVKYFGDKKNDFFINMVRVVILNIFHVYRWVLALEEEDRLETLALN